MRTVRNETYELQLLFWPGLPSLRNRSPSATIVDIYKSISQDLEELVESDVQRSKETDPPFDSVSFRTKRKPYKSESLRLKGRTVETPANIRAWSSRTFSTEPQRPPNAFRRVAMDENDVMDEVLQKYLEQQFAPRLHRDVSVVDFVKLVYNYEPHQIPKKSYYLPEVECHRFCQVTDERSSYKYLQDILESLRKQIHEDAPTQLLDLHFHRLRETSSQANYGSFRPDFFISTHSLIAPWTRAWWGTTLGYGEVKRSEDMHRKIRYEAHLIDLDILLEDFCQSDLIHGPPEVIETRYESAVRHSDIPTGSPTMKRKVSGSDSNERPRNRIRLDVVSEAFTIDDDKHKSAERQHLTQNELQFVKYIDELMSHGVRAFGTGWLLEDTSMSLWYVDRMGLVQATRFDIFKEPHYLLLVVAAMTSASHQDMGVCHLVKAYPSTDKFENWSNMTLELDEAETDTGRLTELKFQLIDVENMYTDHGAVGRGTTIIHIRPVSTTGSRLGVNHDETLVAKIAWPTTCRTPETVFVKSVRQRLLEHGQVDVLKHIVDIKCSLIRTMEEAGLPRAFMNLPGSEVFEERVLHCLIMAKYEPLEMVDNVEQFRKIFIDVVRAHRRVYETSGILHRDISVDNIMFFRQNGEVAGVLCDWDLAYDTWHPLKAERTSITSSEKLEVPESAENTDPSHPPRRAGTGPFMAYELLITGEALPHIYRFDLESFFWLLAWFCATFDPKTHTYVRKTCWEEQDLETIGQKKFYFLSNIQIFYATYQSADAEYRDLYKNWVWRLGTYLQAVMKHVLTAAPIHRKIDGARMHEDEEGVRLGELELEHAKNAAENIITYEGFMRTLGVKEEEW